MEEKGMEEKQKEEAAPSSRDNGKPKKRARVASLTYPGELLQAVPDFQARWMESRKIRRLGSKTTLEAEQKQIDKLAKAAEEWGVDSVLMALEEADSGSYQGIFPKPPGGRRNDQPKDGAQPEDEARAYDLEYGFVQGEPLV